MQASRGDGAFRARDGVAGVSRHAMLAGCSPPGTFGQSVCSRLSFVVGHPLSAAGAFSAIQRIPCTQAEADHLEEIRASVHGSGFHYTGGNPTAVGKRLRDSESAVVRVTLALHCDSDSVSIAAVHRVHDALVVLRSSDQQPAAAVPPPPAASGAGQEVVGGKRKRTHNGEACVRGRLLLLLLLLLAPSARAVCASVRLPTSSPVVLLVLSTASLP
jgi:hypothetical protein